MVLSKKPGICIEIRGFTNNVNDPKSELEISTKRAEVVMNYLVKKGIDPERMRTNSGKSIVETNRRVEIKIVNRDSF